MVGLKDMIDTFPSRLDVGKHAFIATAEQIIKAGGTERKARRISDLIEIRENKDLQVMVKIDETEMSRVIKRTENIDKIMMMAIRQGTRTALLATRAYVAGHKTVGPLGADKYRKAKLKVADSFVLQGGGVTGHSGQTKVRFMAMTEKGIRGKGKSKKYGHFSMSHALNFGTFGAKGDLVKDNIGWEEYFKGSGKGRRKQKKLRQLGGIILPLAGAGGSGGFKKRQKRAGESVYVLPFEQTRHSPRPKNIGREKTKHGSKMKAMRKKAMYNTGSVKIRSRLGGYVPIPELRWLDYYADIAHAATAKAAWVMGNALLKGRKSNLSNAVAESHKEWNSRANKAALGMYKRGMRHPKANSTAWEKGGFRGGDAYDTKGGVF